MNVTRAEPVIPSMRGRWGLPTVLLVLIVGGLLALGAGAASSYNGLVRLDQSVQGQWAQVENAYQRRADLVPSLVETVKGAAGFEKQTLQAVTEARAGLRPPPSKAPAPGELEDYQRSQEALSGALSRLMVVVEAYPQLRATEAFRDLQAQLEGTENRIATERMRFNQAAQEFNTARNRFPTVLFANLFGSRFEEKAYFRARPNAELPPKVQF
jgi:LemA protein